MIYSEGKTKQVRQTESGEYLKLYTEKEKPWHHRPELDRKQELKPALDKHSSTRHLSWYLASSQLVECSQSRPRVKCCLRCHQ